MKIPWRLVGFGAAIFLFFLVVTVPADIALSWFRSRGVVAAGINGSLWNGRASVLRVGNTQLGAVAWNVRFWPLFIGKVGADIDIKRDDGSASAEVTIGLGGRTQIRGLNGSLSVASLGGFGLPGGWQGNVRFQFKELDLENNWPVVAIGSIDADNLVGPAYQPTALGNFRVDFVETTSKVDGLTGTLLSKGEGPLDVKGTLKLLPNRVYTIDAQVATRPTAPASIAKALQYLGPPDSEGRRPLSMSGSL